MPDNVLLNSAFALALGGLSLSVPQYLAFLEPTTILLLQVGLVLTGGFFIASSVIKSNQLLESITASLALVIGGLILMNGVGTTVQQSFSEDYRFDSNFKDNGTLSGDLQIADGGTTIEINDTTGDGFYQSDQIYSDKNASIIQFDRIYTDMQSFDPEDEDIAELRIRTYSGGNLNDVHTYNITEENIQDFNTSYVNSEVEIDSFDWRIRLESRDSGGADVDPVFDSITYETTQTEEVPTNQSDLLYLMMLIVYVLGGIMVSVSLFG